MLQDKSHGINCNAGSGYFSDVCHILGHPSGLYPISNGVVTVQEDPSPDGFPEDEANRENIKSHDKPKGSSHVTQLSTIEDPTVVL